MKPITKTIHDRLFNTTISTLLSREEAAQYLGVTPNTLAVWASVKRYPLPYVKVGRLVKYKRADLDKFIENRTIAM
jgi:excisionase family DNA binding protein